MAQTMLMLAYAADGTEVKKIEGSFDEAPEFYAHQLLHADGVVAVEIFLPDGSSPDGRRSALRRTDPGLVFGDVVHP